MIIPFCKVTARREPAATSALYLLDGLHIVFLIHFEGALLQRQAQERRHYAQDRQQPVSVDIAAELRQGKAQDGEYRGADHTGDDRRHGICLDKVPAAEDGGAHGRHQVDISADAAGDEDQRGPERPA